MCHESSRTQLNFGTERCVIKKKIRRPITVITVLIIRKQQRSVKNGNLHRVMSCHVNKCCKPTDILLQVTHFQAPDEVEQNVQSLLSGAAALARSVMFFLLQRCRRRCRLQRSLQVKLSLTRFERTRTFGVGLDRDIEDRLHESNRRQSTPAVCRQETPRTLHKPLHWATVSYACTMYSSSPQDESHYSTLFTNDLLVSYLVFRFQWNGRCLGCFCTVLLCCLITWATHSHPFRAPVYCGCQPGPTGVLIHPGKAVDQQCANPLAAALLLCARVRPH